MTSTSRTPRRPSIGFCSCSRRTASSSWRSCSVASSPASATLTRQVGEVGQELVQRRVDQPDRHRQPVHRLEDLDEVAALQRFERVQGGLPLLVGLGQDQAARRAGGARRGTCARCGPGRRRSRRTGGPARSPGRCPRWRARRAGAPSSARVMIGCTAATSSSLSGASVALEVLHHVGRDHRDLAQVHHARGAVDGDHVALADHDAAGRGELLAAGVDVQLFRAADAGLAHAAGDHRGVAGLAAAAGEHALGGDHAVAGRRGWSRGGPG